MLTPFPSPKRPGLLIYSAWGSAHAMPRLLLGNRGLGTVRAGGEVRSSQGPRLLWMGKNPHFRKFLALQFDSESQNNNNNQNQEKTKNCLALWRPKEKQGES